MHIPGYLPDSIITENREVTSRGGSRMMEWGQHQLQIPTMHLKALKLKYPELDSSDADIKLRAWKRFLRSAESKPYRTAVPRTFHGLGRPEI